MTKSTIVRAKVTGPPLGGAKLPISLMERASVADVTKAKGRGDTNFPSDKFVPAIAEVVVDLLDVFEPGVDEAIVDVLPVYGAGWWQRKNAAIGNEAGRTHVSHFDCEERVHT